MDKIKNYFENLKGKTVSLIGFGVSHRPVADMFLSHGVSVVVYDRKSEEQLRDIIKEYEGKNIRFVLGENYLDDVSGDVVFRTPGMRPDNDIYIKAQKNGSRITSEMEEFFSLCPCRVVAVTGSDGKSTSTTLISKMLEKQGFKCYLGGNIGKPLLPEIENISTDDFAVVELSSFQLSSFAPAPFISVITNVAPNHLDWHKDMSEYIEAKKNIFRNQTSSSRLVLNFDNDITRNFSKQASARVSFFSLTNKVDNGTYLNENGDIIHSSDGKEEFVMNRKIIRIPGDHNVDNYMTAISATAGWVDFDNIRKIAREFNGVEHRIELVREKDRVKWYNDSIASSPTRTIAGLRSFKQKVILIAGGYDKKIPYEPLAPEIVAHVKVLVLMGATAPRIEKAVREDPNFDPQALPILHADSMQLGIVQFHEEKEPM